MNTLASIRGLGVAALVVLCSCGQRPPVDQTVSFDHASQDRVFSTPGTMFLLTAVRGARDQRWLRAGSQRYAEETVQEINGVKLPELDSEYLFVYYTGQPGDVVIHVFCTVGSDADDIKRAFSSSESWSLVE